MQKLELLTPYAITTLLEKTTYNDMQKSIHNISTKIPPSYKVDKLNKEEKFEDIKHVADGIDFYNYAKLKYMDACCWLINEIEKHIRNMIYYKKDTWNEKYMHDMNINPNYALGLATNPEINTDPELLLQSWSEMEYLLPFFFVKKIMEEKGYILNAYSDKTCPLKVQNEKIYNPSFGFYQKPIETFLLEIEKKQISTDRRRQREEDGEDNNICSFSTNTG